MNVDSVEPVELKVAKNVYTVKGGFKPSMALDLETGMELHASHGHMCTVCGCIFHGIEKPSPLFLRDGSYCCVKHGVEVPVARAVTSPDPYDVDPKEGTFVYDLASCINRHSQENNSDTPDFILAEFLTTCLIAWNKATKQRDKWLES